MNSQSAPLFTQHDCIDPSSIKRCWSSTAVGQTEWQCDSFSCRAFPVISRSDISNHCHLLGAGLSSLLFDISEDESLVSREKCTGALDDILNFRLPPRRKNENNPIAENLLTSQANWASMPSSPRALKSKFQEHSHKNAELQPSKRQKTFFPDCS